MSVIDEPLGYDPADDDDSPEPAAPQAAGGAADSNATGAAPAATSGDGLDADASLVALVERLGIILSSTDLIELEVEAGSTALILRKPAALALDRPAIVMNGAVGIAPAAAAAVPSAAQGAVEASAAAAPAQAPAPDAPSRYRPVAAPLTGIFYTSPSPGAAPYIEVGDEIAIGQVIGLIEAMKLFNEIKSDVAGRVVRIVPENGALVKAKNPLVEVDPR